jgi:hypothetical protein
MLDVLLIISVLTLVVSMIMLCFVLHNINEKLMTEEEKTNYWREKAITKNYEEINSRMKQGLWQD